MPANSMNAAVESTRKVMGSSNAIVSAGPKPGSTPMAIPSVVPTRHHIRLAGLSATAKPAISCENASMSARQEQRFDGVLDHAGADVDAEGLGEAEVGDERECQSDCRVAHGPARAEAARNAPEHQRRGQGEAE